MSEEDTTPHEGATPVRSSDVTRLVRMSLRPPTRFAAGADFTLWLTRYILLLPHLPQLSRLFRLPSPC